MTASTIIRLDDEDYKRIANVICNKTMSDIDTVDLNRLKVYCDNYAGITADLTCKVNFDYKHTDVSIIWLDLETYVMNKRLNDYEQVPNDLDINLLYDYLINVKC